MNEESKLPAVLTELLCGHESDEPPAATRRGVAAASAIPAESAGPGEALTKVPELVR